MGRPAKGKLLEKVNFVMPLVLSHETANVLCHLLMPQNSHLTVLRTYDKTFHCKVILHAYQYPQVMATKTRNLAIPRTTFPGNFKALRPVIS
jgi:hypothetical protein